MRNRYYILFGSLVISLLLWISLNLNLVYELDYKIPVRIDVAKPYAVAEPLPLFFDVKLKGRGWSFIALYTSLSPEFSYNIGTSYDNYYAVIPRNYLVENLGLSSNLDVVDINPDTLIIRLNKYTEKFVKVVPRVSINPKEGYQPVGRIIAEPESIKIGGAENLVNSMDFIYTKEITINNVSSSIYKSVAVTDSLSNILWRSKNEVFIRSRIELSGERFIDEIDININDLPADKDVILIPPRISLQLRGGVDNLTETDPDKISAYINFNELLKDTTGSVVPVIIIPDGIEIINRKPENIQYIIKKK